MVYLYFEINFHHTLIKLDTFKFGWWFNFYLLLSLVDDSVFIQIDKGGLALDERDIILTFNMNKGGRNICIR